MGTARTALATALVFVLGSAQAACFGSPVNGDSSPGVFGRVDFSYAKCRLGCPVTFPIMVGSEEVLAIRSPYDLPDLTKGSSDSGVFELRDIDTTRPYLTLVRAAGPGQALFSLETTDGMFFDGVFLETALAMRLRVDAQYASSVEFDVDTIELFSGGEAPFVTVMPMDIVERVLRASTGVYITVSDLDVVALLPTTDEGAPSASMASAQARLEPRAPGVATLTVQGGGIERDLRVLVW